MDQAKIDAVLSQMGRPRKVMRPHLRHDGDYADGPLGKVAYTVRGAGPGVLLVHGWDGSPRDMSDLAGAFEQNGARVVDMHLPAHGFSDGEKLSVEDAAAGILAVTREAGPFTGVVAHSFGCPSVMLALEQGLKADAVVFFAPPRSQIDQFRRHAPKFGLSPHEIEALLPVMMQARPSMAAMNLDERAAARNEALLIIHSADDEMCDLEGARAIAGAWPGGRLLEADGLGHNMILRDRAMTGAAVRFVLG